jgi:hypothetical protein
MPSMTLHALVKRGLADGVAPLDQDNKIAIGFLPTLTASDVGALATSSRGAANGVAPLDGNALIPTQYLPAQVALGNTAGTALGVAGAGDAATAARSNHTHPMPTATQVGAISASEKGVANGVAPVGNDGYVPIAFIPPLASLRLSLEQARPLNVTGSPGVGTDAAAWDHVHPFPSAAQVGAIPEADRGLTIAELDETGKLKPDQIPLVSFTTGFPIVFTAFQKDVPSSLPVIVNDTSSTDYVYVVQNIGYTDLYLGHSTSVTVFNGFRLVPGDIFRVSLAEGQNMYMIAASGAGRISALRGQ